MLTVFLAMHCIADTSVVFSRMLAILIVFLAVPCTQTVSTRRGVPQVGECAGLALCCGILHTGHSPCTVGI